MAEAIGIASGVLALASLALKSSLALSDTIKDYRHHPKRVRELIEELDTLSDVLRILTKTKSADIDLSFLEIPLRQCSNACKQFELELKNCSSRSGSDRTSFRDWMKLRYMGDGVDEFRQMLDGYKSTISIALHVATLRKSTVTIEKLEDYRSLIKTTNDDLQDHLHIIDEKLESIAAQTVAESNSDSAEVKLIKLERLSTQQCLEVCSQLSDHIDQIQLRPPLNQESSQGRIASNGLQQCKAYLRLTAGMLEKNMLETVDRLILESTNAGSSQAAEDFSRLREEWTTVRHCIDSCSRMDDTLKENISIIENYSTGDDAIQYMVSTDGKIIHGKNQGLGSRPKQVGGHLTDMSLQQISADITKIHIHTSGDLTPSSQDGTTLKVEKQIETCPSPDYQERYGPGMKLASNSTPNVGIASQWDGRNAEPGRLYRD